MHDAWSLPALLAFTPTNSQLNARAGQGPGKSRLVFPKPLSAVLGAGKSYTYGPAYLQFNGANWLNAQTLLATITAVSTAYCTLALVHHQKEHIEEAKRT
jgi:hypothetical protein